MFTLNLLYRFISYGKHLYLFLVISGLLLNYFNGSVVNTSFGSVIDQVGGMVSGAILILLYFSPIKNIVDSNYLYDFEDLNKKLIYKKKYNNTMFKKNAFLFDKNYKSWKEIILND